MFEKVLVANRGEIAIRVMRACRELDINTVAVYSDADKKALFTNYADEAYHIGGSHPSQSYLNVEKIVSVAEEAGADAIHPGYGFLAENPKLPKECEKRGIKFIGPSASIMKTMGDKIAAKKLMSKVGVPTIPGTEKGVKSVKKALKIADEIGYPVIIKAAAGGGGVGMRTVYEEDEMERAMESAKSLAKSVFGDSRVYIEKYFEKPRHIEFQVLADEHGNAIHLGDRECSIQRRHQKLIEEAPSPIVNKELREKIGSMVVNATKEIGYTNAGTFEFLYADGNFYFLEMNTRIQVEHPVTEAVTGIDIVKEQIKIAAGEELNITQKDVKINGHAIECRINAEDPLSDFQPCPGKITGYRSPGGIGVRVDSGVYMGYEIPSFYDSMISKLIVWGRNRKEAIVRMRRALSEYIIIGVKTTIPFHKAMMVDPLFVKGELHTQFVDQHKKRIEEEMKKIIEKDRERVSRQVSTFLPPKKVAAITAAIGSYIAHIQKKGENK